MGLPSSILIVGAGQAAAVACASLRSRGYQGSITLAGDEPHLPYERPPLSKDLLMAQADAEPNLLVKPHAFYADNEIDARLGVRVEKLNPQAQSATLSDGTTISFDKCLLATGGLARTLPQFPETSDQVFYLRTLDDAKQLRSALKGDQHLVVIGGGFLGLEVASTARTKGMTVSVIENAPRVLARVVPPQFSSWLQQQAENEGVTLHLGQALSSVTPPHRTGQPWQLTLDNGETLNADVVVVAVGLTANASLAREAGLSLDDKTGGILVDDQCQTSHHAIYAAGDCTSQRREQSAEPLRLESWQNANEQARIAAAAMLGATDAPAAYPWFWTDQFGHNIQMLGLPAADLHYVTRGETTVSDSPQKFITVGLRDDVPVTAIAVNAGGDLRALRPLFESKTAIDPAQFADPSVTVRAFAKRALAETKPAPQAQP